MKMTLSRVFPLLLLGLCVGTVATAAGADAPAAAAEKTIVFFGDSLTAGYGLTDPELEAYPALIRDRIQAASLPWKVVNAGLSGDTTSGGLRRIDWVLRQPMDAFVLALGANDGLRGVSPAVTKSNLQAIIDKVRAKYPKIPIVVAGMMMPPSLGTEFSRDFNALFPDLAKKNDALLVPFLLENVAAIREMNQGDQIHPNRRGHALVAENVWRVLRTVVSQGLETPDKP